ncbi:MAG TPA: LamG-like jellyroll fold domain-containing protein, partial [Bryobacteraceae bacterium]
MIVFGGALATGGLGNDVWVLTNANGQGAPATWFQLLPSGSPPSPRRYLQGFFDAHTNRLILFGGETEGTVTNNEVWVLTNANGLGGSPAWIQLTPSGSPPSPRAVYAGAYDPGSNCFMVFGGSQYYSYSQGLNDYWVLKNANGLSGSPTWIEVFQDGLAGLPPPRTYSSMIYDLSSNRAVLFGGYSPGCGDNDPCTNSKQNDVWVLNNANVSDVETPQWNQVFPAGVQPQPRAVGTGAAYDPTSDRMMIFGGGITPVLNDTWILANATGRLASNHSTSDSTTIDSSSVPDLTISKSHTDNFTLGQTGATYTITVTNRGSGSTTGAVTVTDSLPTGLTATNLTGTGWSCALATLTCTRSDALAAGGSYPLITLAVNVASNASASVTNTATASGGGESNTGNDSASDVTTIAPVIAPGDLALNKLATQSSTLSGVAFDGASDAVDGNTDGNFYDGSVTHTNVENNAWWQVDLGASAAVNSVTVWNRTDCCSDRLADYWVFVSNTPFSSTDTPATLQSRAGTWSNHQTSAPNPSTTVSVLGSHGQYVRVQLDGTNYLSLAEVQVMGAIDVSPNPDLTIAKTHVGNFTQGQTGAAYTITVTNSGTAPTTGTVTVIDTLPPILTATDISGTGWSCTLGTLTCTRNDALAAGTSYPVITLTVNVAPTNAIYVAYDYPALNGTGPNLGNQAWGGALGMDFNVNSPINVLTLGAFDSGHDGLANAITVSLYDRTNQAAPVASLILNPSDPGLISIDSGLYLSLPAPLSLPAGFLGTIVAYGYSTNEPNGNRNEGANFNAATLDTGGGSIAYLNSSPFGAGTGYPNEPFDGFNNEFGAGSFTFSPATNAAASVINSVSVSGGGEQNTANDTATDVTIITPAVGPDLTITKSHASNFTQGQTGAIYTVAVMNSGTGPTTGTVTVTDSLPTGLTATNLTGTGWTCALATLTCSRSDALAAAGSYPAITLTVNVASNAPASVTNTAVVSGGGETNISNDLASDPTTITSSSLPDLTITKSHAGNFMQGQSGGTYTITVTNSGTASTIGTVIVADALPAGLAASGLSGTGWSCALGTLTCTRSDALAATTSYPAITLTINVASDAQASVTNTATVSGGGEMNTSNDTASDVTSITPPATCLTPPAGLVSWWPGDGNTSDLQGANDPSASNAVTFVPGQVGTGFTFGAGGYIDIPASPSLANQQFTLAAWVRPDGPGPNNDAFGSWIVGQDFDNTHAVYLYWRATDNHFGFEFGSQSSEAIVSQDSFPIGPFYLVTGSYDGTTFKLYVNGTLEGQLTETTSIPYTTNTWTIGSSPANIRNQGYPRTWNGVIDEVQVFDRAIGLGEIQTVFASGSVGECKPSSTTPDLTITKTHVGNFVLGQNGAVYTITVGNAGLALSVGTVSVVDAFPAGLTPVTIGGAGWTCALGTLACTRSDALAPAASYPPITLTVNVSPSAPAQVTNTATVSGGDEQNLANDVANDQTTIITAPPVLTVLSGDAQFGTVGQALGSPLIVKYASADGVALVGVPVTFSVTAGGGSLNGASPQVVVNTNAQGVASANLILGPIPGVNTVQATTSTSVVVSFGATGVGAITLTSGNNQVAAAGTALANPFVVTVVGAAGPLANIAVNFAATGGGGSLSASSVNTDTLGHASAILTLGPSAGSNIVTASVDGLIGSPITFTAAGQPLLGIAASPNPLSFGDVPIFASSTQAVTLTNTGQNPVTVTSITIAGNYFSLANLATLPLAIPPSGSTIFNVVFSPNATIPASATVSIASAATTSPISVLVSGNGTPPASPAPNLVTVATDQTAYRRGQPVKISGTATAADGTGIRNIPVQVQVALNGSARTLSPYTDFQGSFQTVFMPTAADGGTFSVTATASSKSITKTAGAAFRIAGLLVNPNSVTQDQVTGTTSTIPLDLQNIGDSQLTNVTFAATVTPAGAMTATFPQSISTLSTGGPITIPVSLTAPAGDPPAMPVSVQVQISATDPQSGLVDTETVPMTITLRPAVSTPVLLPSPIHLGVNPGKSLSVNLYVRNDGYLPMTNAAVALQNAGSNNWVSLGNANLGTVNHGDLRQFQLDVNPPANVALGDYQFNLSITGGTSPVQGSFIVTVTQLTVGNAAFAVNDDTGSTVGGATVTLYGTTNGKQFSMMTASDGTVTIPGVDAGDYTYVVAADSHDPYSGSVTVLPNATVSTGVILSYEVVSLTFTVTPTTIVDQYNVSLYITYSTTLPKPALQVVPYSMQLSFFPEDLTNGKYACKVNVTNTHPTASVRNLFLDASQLDVAQPAGQQIHVFFADGVQTYQVGVLAGKASVDVPCYATIDSGTIPSHSVGNIVVQANYDYSLQGQVLQGTTTTNVPVSYIRPSELQYDPIPFVYDKKTDPANPVLRYDAGGYLYTVKSNRNIPINLLQPAGVPFNGNNLVAFVQTQAGAS